jgi:peptidoglycan-N-acetylglucosamine deacetylase
MRFNVVAMLDALLFAKTPSLFTHLYPGCLWKIDTDKKVLYLTFDDGPIADVTPFVLDTLKQYQAKATFFCIGKNVEAHPGIFRRIIREGHAIGNHTYNHLNGWQHANTTYFKNIEQCNAVLKKFTPPKKNAPAKILFRPPYGKLKPSQYLKLKTQYKIVMWDILTFDYDLNKRRSTVLNTVMKHGAPGAVVVFHDSLKAWPRLQYALPKVLEHFSHKGYKFERL